MEIKTYLDDNEICKYLQNYINNTIYDYAVMIDGEWGCGKTYFVKNVLIPKLKENEEKTSIEIKKKKFVYTSLYGIKTIDELNKQIYMNAYLNNEKKKKGFSFSSSAMSIGFDILKIKGIELEEDSIKDFLRQFLSLDKVVLFFDDLERCECPINEVFGFVNSFVEHDHMKVVFIANEKEIIKNNNSYFTNSKNEIHEEIYYTIKEKIIGETIKYYTNIIKSIKPLIKNSNIKDEIKNEINLDIFSKACDCGFLNENEINLRVIQFFLYKFNMLYPYFDDMDKRIKSSFIKSVSFCLLIKCIEYKTNKNSLKIINNTFKKQGIEIEEIICDEISCNYIDYYYLNNFIICNKINKKAIEEMISFYKSYYIKENKESIESQQYIYTLQDWKHLNDNILLETINKILKDLEKDKYLIETYPKILKPILELTYIGLDEHYLQDIKSYMLVNIKTEKEFTILPIKKSEDFDIDIAYQYNTILNELNCAIRNIEYIGYAHKTEKIKALSDYISYFQENRIIKMNYSLFNNIDYDDLIKQIILSSSFELYYFVDEFIDYYENGNNLMALKFDNTYLKKMMIDLMNIDKKKLNLSQIYNLTRLRNFLNKIYPNLQKLDKEQKELSFEHFKDLYEID